MKILMQRRLYGHVVILHAWAFSKVIRQIEYTVQKEAKELTGRYKQTAVGSKLRHGFATDLAYTVKRNIKPRLLISRRVR